MRSFIAIDIDKDIAHEARRIINDFRNLDLDVKFVEPENLHITLKFLGEIDEDDVKLLCENVSEVCNKTKIFKISFKHVSFFGSMNHVRTLWIGMGTGREDFISLSENIGSKIGFNNNGNSSPHLTIGRVRSGKNKELIMKKIEKYKNVNIGEMEVKNVKLKKSTLTPNGPVYEDISTFELMC